MPNDDEVVDVEQFYENLQNKSFDDLDHKYRQLQKENDKLDKKVYGMRRDNDKLRHKLFEQDQLRYKVACLLGFENAGSATQSISQEEEHDGQTALSEARSRLLLLEDELAKNIAASSEAQAVLTETDNQLKLAHQHLADALEEASRLRGERDSARKEAERQAMEAAKWRDEVQTTLPEMQNLIRELQNEKTAQLGSRLIDESEKENRSPGRLERGTSPFRKVANASSPTAVHSSPTCLAAGSDEHYKSRFELLEAKYQSLLETKEKISQRFREHLLKWKRFKSWLLKEQASGGGKATKWRRVLRRRKAVDKIGPLLNEEDMAVNGGTLSAPRRGSVKDSEFTVKDSSNETSALERGGATNGSHRSNKSPGFPMLSNTPSPNKSRVRRDLNGSYNVQPRTTVDLTPGRLIEIKRPDSQLVDEVVLSQESLTQPSSVIGDGVSQAHEAMLCTPSGRSVGSQAIIMKSSPIRGVASDEPGRPDESATDGDEPTDQQVIKHLQDSGLLRKSPLLPATPRPAKRSQLDCKRPMITHSMSELPPTKRRGLFSRTPDRQAITQTSSVLVMDTPPRTSPKTVLRHRSSPPDSPHLARLTKRKRKDVDIGKTSRNDESDPFTIDSPCAGTDSANFQTRREKLAHLKALGKKSHKAYMAEYMQFKGRGRYSNVHATPEKTINDKFEIDPSKNRGLNFPYDAIVRDKAERRLLEAGDCDCCRAYYEAIGTPPPRPQAPLWKSPSPSQNLRTARPCRYKRNNVDQEALQSSPNATIHKQAIDAHKHDISRHRHDWAPPKTPPDFWKIEFPDTQAVDDINRRANEMHASKFRRVEAEANSNSGRYRKRI